MFGNTIFIHLREKTLCELVYGLLFHPEVSFLV